MTNSLSIPYAARLSWYKAIKLYQKIVYRYETLKITVVIDCKPTKGAVPKYPPISITTVKLPRN